jgi:cytoskeletal protein CcmA (bactofilin family)
LILKNEITNNTTFIGAGTLFKGLLCFEGTVCIDGKFEGMVDTPGTLVISESGEMIADIEAGIVICKGQVKGNITATQKVEMHPLSKITGNVKSPSLSIEIGAKVEGSIDMSNKVTASKISLDAP